MAGTVIADNLQAAATSQLVIKNGVASTPPTIQDSAGTTIGTFCRAWVNFNGTGTVAIRASFNVSSITDNGTGDYTLNFTTAMPDANYSVVASGRGDENINRGAGLMIDIPKYTVAPTTAAISLRTGIGATATNNGVLHDPDFVFVSVFR
jgi:hypothetical protein